ncbi:MAG: hypothetical protein RIM84_09745 [Alphaproteobacteria bacterium]
MRGHRDDGKAQSPDLAGSGQKPCASTCKGALNLLRKFSIAMPAVSSTISGSLNRSRSLANSSSSTLWPVIVTRSA